MALSALGLVALAACSSSTTATQASSSTSASTSTSSPSAAPRSPSASTDSAAQKEAAALKQVDCKKLKCVALTYDDGPSQYTPALLKAYTRRHANATLFMLGNAAKAYPDTVKQAYQEGFEIANHTWDHKAISSLSDAQVAQEVSSTSAELKKLTGVAPILMRPPYAARTKRTDKVVGANGMAVVVWSNSPEDWVAGHDSAEVITRLTLQRTSRNSIILMHDIHPWTVKAAPAVIDGLQKQGYTLVTVSQLLGKTIPGHLYPAA